MAAKVIINGITDLALRELAKCSTIADLMQTKGYVSAAEARRRLGIGQVVWRSDRGSW